MQKLNGFSKTAVGTGAVVTGVGALIGGRIGYSIAGFGLAHMVLGGANLIHASAFRNMKSQILK